MARAALESGAVWLAVNRSGEGTALRRAGIGAPILVMGYSPAASVTAAVEDDLALTVTDLALAEALSAAAGRAGKTVRVHVKVDTGMGRFGMAPEEVVDFACALGRLPGLALDGLFTHFAVADQADKSYTRRQFAVYCQVLAALEAAGIRVPVRHAANSAAALDLPEMHLDAVRVGIALYGLHPSQEVEPAVALRPALALKSRVAQVRRLPAGSSISYGRTFITERPSTVALISCGYGDGYARLNSNRGAVLVGGERAPIRGRVCMDQFVVEVPDGAEALRNDEVVLIGQQGDERLSAEEVASWAETINYEITTQLLPRVPRIYLRGGEVVSQIVA